MDLNKIEENITKIKMSDECFKNSIRLIIDCIEYKKDLDSVIQNNGITMYEIRRNVAFFLKEVVSYNILDIDFIRNDNGFDVLFTCEKVNAYMQITSDHLNLCIYDKNNEIVNDTMFLAEEGWIYKNNILENKSK